MDDIEILQSQKSELLNVKRTIAFIFYELNTPFILDWSFFVHFLA